MGAAAERALSPGLLPGAAEAIRMKPAQKFPVDAARNRESLHGAEVDLHAMAGGNPFQFRGLILSSLSIPWKKAPPLLLQTGDHLPIR